MPLIRSHRRNCPLYIVPAWERLPIVHGFGTRDIGLAPYLGDNGWWIPATRQVHGDTVHVLDAPPVATMYIGDAFITRTPQVVCAIRTADCLPLLLIDPVRLVIGAVHAGWRGLAAGVIQRTVDAMVQLYRVDPQRLLVALGPAIGGADYEVDAPVLTALRQQNVALDHAVSPASTHHWYLDVRGLATQLLMTCGIDERHITTSALSTYARPGEFHSYRRQPSNAGRQFSFIGITAGTRPTSLLRPAGR